MLCASCGCLFIALDALRIILDVFCIVCDAWASFDACASHVELGAPWVTEASLLRGIFLFFLFYFVAFGISIYSSYIYLEFAGYITLSHTLDAGWLCGLSVLCHRLLPLTLH